MRPYLPSFLILLAPFFCSGPVPAAPVSDKEGYERVDDLYFNRHRAGKLERSVELLEARLRDAPEDSAALWRLARSLVRTGERLEGKRERIELFSRAERLAERSAELAPREPEAHYWHGLALGRNGETRGMLRSLFMIGPLKRRMRRVLELDPGHGGARHVLGEMLRQVPRLMGGSKKRAVRELEAGLRSSPERTGLYPSLGRAYLAVGKKERAREVLLEVFKVEKPYDPAASAGHLEDARDMLKELD